MEKLWLIIRREYLTRVRRRSFILATFLTPVAMAVFFTVVFFIFSYESDDVRRIAIIDEDNILEKSIKDEENLYFQFVEVDLGILRENFSEFDYDGILVIPPLRDVLDRRHTVYYYSDGQLSLDLETLIRDRLSRAIRNYKIDALDLDRKELEALDTRIDLQPEPIAEDGDRSTTMRGVVGAAIGGLMGLVMYLTVFIYGMMVMRSVMEEKTSRIVEVMISSVRPFQLMLGKIIGVGAVGLTQVLIWAVMIPLVVFSLSLLFGLDAPPPSAAGPGSMAVPAGDAEAMAAMALEEFRSQPWGLILTLFVLFFLGGYFLYASLFAAVGSAMGDDLGEGQSLTIPITIPVLLAFYIMFKAVEAPHSSLAVWSSIFPLFSPIVMPARLAFDPPAWEIVVSLLVLGLTAIFFVWLSGRIYRTAILMYGKKLSWREMLKWLFYKD